MSHEDRKPICECEDPEPKTLGEGTPVEYEMCKKCNGVIEKESLSDKLLDRKETFIEDKNLNEDQEEAVEDFVTWLTFRIDYGDEEI